MKDLLFLTDRYPFNNSEAFIENEINFLADHFDRVFVLPCGLMVNTEKCRTVPENVKVLKPAVDDDIFQNKPNFSTKLRWGLTHLFGWYIACLFNSRFYEELKYLQRRKELSVGRFLKIFRALAPSIRNAVHYKKMLLSEDLHDVYVYSYWIEPTVLMSRKICNKTKIVKTICRTHRWDLYSEENSYNYLPFQRQIIESVDTLFSISEDGVKYLSDKYADLAKKIKCSYLGTRDYGTNPLKNKDNSFVIVSCSNLIPVKRVNLLIDGLEELGRISDSKEIVWIHFGTGQYHEQIESYAQEKLQKCISYQFAGQVSNQELMRYYQNNHVDVFVNVSSSEGIPVSIMEAASFSIPIIATDVGGTKELVVDGVNGILLPKEFKTEQLSEAISTLMNDSEKREEMGLKSRQIWSNSFNSQKNYSGFVDELLS